jgi:hypothetical protein
LKIYWKAISSREDKRMLIKKKLKDLRQSLKKKDLKLKRPRR